MPPIRGLRFDALLMFANQAALGGLNFAASVAVARALGPAGRGAVAVALVTLVALVQLGSLGITAAHPYYTARDSSLAARLVPATLWLAAGTGGVLVGVVLWIRWLVPSIFTGVTWLQLGLVVSVLPAALVSVFLQSILLGQGRTVAYNGVQLILGGISVGVLLAVTVFGHLHTSVALICLLVQYPLSVMVYLYLLPSSQPLFVAPDLGLFRRLIRFGLRSYPATVLSFLVIRLDLLLVNLYLGTRQAGLYSVAVVLAQSIYLLPVAVGVNILPRVARGASAAATAQVFRVVALIYGGLCIITVPVAGPFIRTVFGASFSPSVGMFYWLLPGTFSLGMLVILGSHLAGRGYPARATIMWACGLVFNVAANMLLLPRYGAYMASVVSSITYTAVLMFHIHLFVTTSEGDVHLWPRPRELRLVLAGWPRRA